MCDDVSARQRFHSCRNIPHRPTPGEPVFLSGRDARPIFCNLSIDLTGGWLRAFLPVLVWATLVWLIGGIDDVPGDENLTKHFDEVAHLVMYGLLGFLSGRAWRMLGGGVTVGVILVVLALGMGVADEWRQLSMSGRTGSVTDWLADAAGVLGGFFLAAT